MSEERKIEITGPHEIPGGGGWSVHISIDRRIDQIYAQEFATKEEATAQISEWRESPSKELSSLLG